MPFDAPPTPWPTLTLEGVTVPARRCSDGQFVPVINPEHAYEIAWRRIDREVREAHQRRGVVL